MAYRSNKNRVFGNARTTVGLFLAFGIAIGVIALLWITLVENKSEGGISPSALYSIRLRSPDGQTITLGQWPGKILLLNFWATWCSPCREEIPRLMDAQRRYAENGVQIVGIAVDTPEKVTPYVKEMALNYPTGIDEESGINLSRRLGNQAGVLPFSAIIDRQGRVIATIVGSLSEAQINEQLRKSLATARLRQN